MPSILRIIILPLTLLFSKIIAVSGENKQTNKVGLSVICYCIKLMPQNSENPEGTRRTVDHLNFDIHNWRRCVKNSSSSGPFMCHGTLMHKTVRRPAITKWFASNVLAGMASRLLKMELWILHY